MSVDAGREAGLTELTTGTMCPSLLLCMYEYPRTLPYPRVPPLNPTAAFAYPDFVETNTMSGVRLPIQKAMLPNRECLLGGNIPSCPKIL